MCPVLLRGDCGIVGIVCVALFPGIPWATAGCCAAGACPIRDPLRAPVREEERGGTLSCGMLYILEMLLSSGAGILEVRP